MQLVLDVSISATNSKRNVSRKIGVFFLPSNLPSYVWLNKGIYKYMRKSEVSSGLYSVSGLLAVRIRLGREKINDAMFRTKIVFKAIVA